MRNLVLEKLDLVPEDSWLILFLVDNLVAGLGPVVAAKVVLM